MFKNIFRISLIACLALVACVAHAQVNATLAPPVLSFVLDSARMLRPLTGIARSASIGAPLNLGFEITQAAIPPDHDYILATAREGGQPALLQLRGDVVTVRPIDGLAKISGIALSPTGSAAGFLSASEGRIHVFSNLSQSPSLLGKFEIGGLGPVSAFGISDDGRTVALGVSDGVRGSLFFVSLDQTPRLIASVGHPSAIRFLRNSEDAVIADDAENKILALSSGQVFVIATAEDGISAPVGIAVSNDNRKVFVGNSRPGSVMTMELFGTVAAPLSCNCTLTGLHPTNADSVYRLTDFLGGPVLLFDGTSAEPRIIFVPVGWQ